MESYTLRVLPIIKRAFSARDVSNAPAFPDPYATWLKMIAFGAGAAAVALALSAAWNFAQLAARIQRVPSRQTMGSVFPYVALGIEAFKWMGVWALTSVSPLVEPRTGNQQGKGLVRWRIMSLRLLVTASFIILSLRLWGMIGTGLRPAFNTTAYAFQIQVGDMLTTVLLWTHLRALAENLDLPRLVVRCAVVMIGRGGTILFLFLIPLLFLIEDNPLPLSWQFVNIRICLAVLWDVIAVLVLVQFAKALVRMLFRLGG